MLLPDNKMGYTENYLFNWFQENGYSVEEFKNWILGQTVAMTDNGEVVYYGWDVERYMNLSYRNPKPER